MPGSNSRERLRSLIVDETLNHPLGSFSEIKDFGNAQTIAKGSSAQVGYSSNMYDGLGVVDLSNNSFKLKEFYVYEVKSFVELEVDGSEPIDFNARLEAFVSGDSTPFTETSSFLSNTNTYQTNDAPGGFVSHTLHTTEIVPFTEDVISDIESLGLSNPVIDIGLVADNFGTGTMSAEVLESGMRIMPIDYVHEIDYSNYWNISGGG